MITSLTILGTIFGIVSATLLSTDHIPSGLFFAIIAIIFLTVAFLKNNKEVKKTTTRSNDINLKEFKFIDPPGYYTHPKYSYWICPRCLVKENQIAPISEVDETAWYCTVCNQPLSGSLGDAFTVDW